MLLQVEKVTKYFNGLKALDEVSVYLKEKEIVGLIGPNGAGKTTLLNIIMGTYKPNKGVIIFNGRRIDGLRPDEICKMGIARTFQIVKPITTLKVIDNVLVAALFGKDERLSINKAREISINALEFVGLKNKMDYFPSNLTITELRKLELARAIATRPKLILIDEVLAGLNVTEVNEMLEKIRELNKEMGVTILMVEHIMHAIMSISERIIVLHHGKKIAEGRPEEIVNNPLVIKAYLGERFSKRGV